MENIYDKKDIKEIAYYQTLLCWTWIIPYVAIFIVYRLAKAEKVKHPGLHAFGMFLPLVCLVVTLSAIQNATKILRSKNILVGIMGAKKESLNNYLNSPSE